MWSFLIMNMFKECWLLCYFIFLILFQSYDTKHHAATLVLYENMMWENTTIYLKRNFIATHTEKKNLSRVSKWLVKVLRKFSGNFMHVELELHLILVRVLHHSIMIIWNSLSCLPFEAMLLYIQYNNPVIEKIIVYTSSAYLK